MVRALAHHQQAALTALQFAQAVHQSPHVLMRVFFYGPGVTVASEQLAPSADEPQLTQQWAALAAEGVDLVVCATAGYRFGVLSPEQAAGEHRQANLQQGFRSGSLADFVAQLEDYDRVISFG